MPELGNIASGTLPQWLLVVIALFAFIKWVIPWRADEMRKLRAEIKECEADCARRLAIIENQAKKVENDLWGEKRQRVTEQISMVNAIIQSVDAPELQAVLRAFESVQARLRVNQIMENGIEPH